ncbi:hypothetical protein BDN70DRAFT_726008 [Pholiota conissans]|uniref:PH domain-containing protein n=1 Tax=Pholiota conissans TaxID=109636 RepID=A0A9P5Z2W6_9AGAR|nr:hypothetical protein BDN70DRAFT_726008 [Pholiota conissans]
MMGPREMGAGTPSPGTSSRTRSSSSHPNQRQHNISGVPRTPAQQLIDQYERLSTPPPTSPTHAKSTYKRQYISDPKAVRSYAPQRKSNFMDRERRGKGHQLLKKDGRSPIRQSLRNLLSVIKKGAEGIGKRKPEDKSGMPYNSLDLAGKGRSKDGLETLAVAPNTVLNESSERDVTTSNLVSHPRKRMMGALLYLSRGMQLLSPELPGPLMWTTCSVTIDGNKLVVSSTDYDAEPIVHEISLLRCTDIRSLGTMQLSVEEADLLDRLPEGENLCVFEVLFEGKQREKFAAKSVRERAGWISAIWDTILPIQKAGTPEKLACLALGPENCKKQRNFAVGSPRPKPIPQLSPLLVASNYERSLPPLPPASLFPPQKIPPVAENKHNAPNLHLDLSDLQGPISPSIYPPTSHVPSPATSGSLISPGSYPTTTYMSESYFVASPTSMTATTPSSSCPTSPSIMNLGHLSVVRQRLAQIERNHSHLSAQSHGTNRTTPLPSPASSSGWSRREALFSNDPKTPSRSRPTSFAEDKVVIIPQPRDNGSNGQKESVSVMENFLSPRESKSGASKEDIRQLFNGLTNIKGVIGGESGHPTVHQMVAALERHAKGEKEALRNIQDSLTVLGERVIDAVATPRENARTKQIDASVIANNHAMVLKALTEVKDQLAVDFSALVSKVEDMHNLQKGKACAKLHDIPSPANDTRSTSTDIRPVLDKLEEIRALCNDSKEVHSNPETGATQVEKILSLVQEDGNKQSLLSQQQADSVRYLNELNSWLEAFVKNGTSQIQGISVNLDRLCGELGFSERTNDPQSQPNLVNDIRQLVAGMKARDQNFTSLQAAVHSLLEILTASQSQKGADSQAIAGLMNQQRHDQEILFRAFTNGLLSCNLVILLLTGVFKSEISGEIKGERLRFVEAMKEATAINIQLHVEQFKQELGREVMAMTEEVGRLHREKLNVENQISDLFSFHTKYKQGEKPLQTIQENVILPRARQLHEQPRSNLPRSHPHRLLPHPRQ